MASTTASELQPVEEYKDKGLKSGALGLISSIVMGVASTAPAYSLAATLFFVVAAVGLKSPAVAVLAFIPMLLCSIGYSEMNKADPDCGTTFTWATRAFGPKTGWAGGWAIVAADVLVMASLAQVAGQYVFLLFGANGIGQNPTSGWVLLTGIIWIVVMTYICYRGIEVSAWFQRILLTIEIIMLLVLAVTALVKTETSHPAGSITPSFSWLLPTHLGLSAFISGLILMLFIYWGWDTAVSVNEETKDKAKTPGRAAIISTVILLITYAIVIFGIQVVRRDRHQGHRAGQPRARVRRAVGHGLGDLRQQRLRHVPVPAAHPDGAHLGFCLDADDDPADRPHHPVDGRLQGHPRGLLQDPSPVPDADRLHARHGRRLDRPLHPVQLHSRGQPDRRRGHGDRALHRLLLRADRLVLCLVLPQDADQQRPEPVDAGHPAGAGLADHVGGGHLQPAERLGGDRTASPAGPCRACTGRSAGSS